MNTDLLTNTQIGPATNTGYTPPVAPAPTVSTPTVASPAPVTAPVQNNSTSTAGSIPSPYSPFSLDTSKLTSNHLSGDATPSSVQAYRDQLQGNLQSYLGTQQPLQKQLADTTLFSPEEIEAQRALVNLTNRYNAGKNDILAKPIALEFQQGQEAALTRDYGIQQSGLAAGLNYLENVRQNRVSALTTLIGQNEKNYTNTFNTTNAGQTNAIAAGQLGVSQEQLGLSRYQYEQITDPNTGFPVIQVIDKNTGLPAGTVSPGSPTGQAITQSGVLGGTGNTASNPVVASTMTMIGAKNDMPVSTAIQTLGLPAIINGLINQEGGSPQGVTNNPGNIKFANLPGQTNSGVQATDGGTFASYSTNQAGIDAVGQLVQNAAQGGSSLASFIARYKGVTNTQNAPASMDEAYKTVVDSAPIVIKNAIKQLPDGTPYIDGALLNSPQAQLAASAYAGHTGVRMVSAEDAKAIDSAKQAIANLGAQSALFAQLAPTSAIGSLGANIADPFKLLFDTDKGSLLKTYNSNRDNLLQQIRTLAGSSPRLNANELNLAANSMPTLYEGSKNTIKDGINKLVLTASYLDNAIRALNPDYVGSPVNVNGQYAIMGPDGQAYQFPTREAAITALQIKNQTK